ncbi:MAG: hypothetical protein JJ895_05640 [Balneolaceae bacterium]|nr:hypothetical protein [Balneolaceae bacterium]
MKKLLYIIVPILLILPVAQVSAQNSDYELVKDFNSKTELISHKIQNAITTVQIQGIEAELDSVEQKYADHKEIINHAIYPATFNEEIEALRANLITNEHRLYLIENQREQLFDLSNQVMAHRAEINRMYAQVDSLNREIELSQASEARLSQLVQNYRNKVEQRDRLLFGMIDSLLFTHQKLQATMSTEQSMETYMISDDSNPLAMIHQIIEQNIEATHANNAMLSVNDHLRMRSLQIQFERTWDRTKDDFTDVYSNDDVDWGAQIDSALKQWRMIASKKMWDSVDQYLAQNEIDLGAFDNRLSFYQAMDSFIAEGYEISKDEFLVSDSFQEFVEFEEFWNETFKTKWIPKTPEGVLLSEDQISTIDAALTDWEETARPIHPMLAAIIALAIVSLTGFILVMAKARKAR